MSKKISTGLSVLFIAFLILSTFRFYSISQDDAWSRDFTFQETVLLQSAERFTESLHPHIEEGGYYLSNALLNLWHKVYGLGVSESVAEEIFFRLPSILMTIFTGIVCFFLGFLNMSKDLGLYDRLSRLIFLAAGLVIFYYQFNNFYLFQSAGSIGFLRVFGLFFFALIAFKDINKKVFVISGALLVLASPLAWVFLAALLSADFTITKSMKRYRAFTPFMIRTLAILAGCSVFLSVVSIVAGQSQLIAYENLWPKFLGWWREEFSVFLLGVCGCLIFLSKGKNRPLGVIFLSFVLVYIFAPVLNLIALKEDGNIWLGLKAALELIYPLFLFSLGVSCDIQKIRKAFIPLSRIFLFKSLVVVILVLLVILGISRRYTMEAQSHAAAHDPKTLSLLLLAKENSPEMTKKALIKQLVYYRWISVYDPKRAESYGLMGYCSYKLGRTFKAIQYYKKALARKKGFFWYHYNLGVIYFKTGQYFFALNHFHEALGSSAKETFDFMMNSKDLYLPIFHLQAAREPNFFERQFKDGHRNAFLLSVVIFYHLDDIPSLSAVTTRALQNDLDNKGQFHYFLSYGMYRTRNQNKTMASLRYATKKNSQYEALLQTHLQLLNRKAVTMEVLDAFYENVPAIARALSQRVDLEIF